ncbi:tetratricopeptide repeat protein [Phaeodactylibacter xiamenensis]|uniref:tetratricopeptide repeat protein n=1 Tax=Phaeodactylibacter xiamenensis TaxID=1524460 RepID=UPI003CCB7A25
MSVKPHTYQTADWDELEYVLSERQKPATLVCSFDTLSTKEKAIAQFKSTFPQYTQHEIDTTGEQVVSLFRYLNEKLPALANAQNGNIQTLVHLSGLEYSLMAEDPAGPGLLLPELNFERELVFRDLPLVLVIWVNHYTLKRLQKEAPDFWDWVQYQYHFSSPPELVDRDPVAYDGPLPSKGFTPERLARVEEMEARYQRLDQSGDNREQTLQNIANLLETLGREHLEIFEGEKAVAYFTKLLAVRERLGDKFELAAAYFYLGEAYRIDRQMTPAVAAYQKALNVFLELDQAKSVARCHHQIGIAYEEQRQWDQALEHYHKAIEWKEKTQQHHELGSSYHQIGIVYQLQRQWDQALENYHNAIEWFEKTKQSHQLGSSYHHIGMVYEEQRQWDKALEHYHKAIEWKEKTQQHHRLGSSYHQLGIVYQEQRQWDQALEHYHKAIEWKEKTQQHHELGSSYHQIGMVYQKQRQWEQALEHYHQAIELYEETKQPHELDVTYACIGLVHKAQEDHKTARQYLEKALILAKKHNTPFIGVIEEALKELD